MFVLQNFFFLFLCKILFINFFYLLIQFYFIKFFSISFTKILFSLFLDKTKIKTSISTNTKIKKGNFFYKNPYLDL